MSLRSASTPTRHRTCQLPAATLMIFGLLNACVAPTDHTDQVARMLTGLPPIAIPHTLPGRQQTSKPVTINPSTLLSLAKHNTAEIIGSDLAIQSSQLDLEQARSTYWPRVAITPSTRVPIVGTQTSVLLDINRATTVSLDVNWSLFSFVTAIADEYQARRRFEAEQLRKILALKEAQSKAILLYLDYVIQNQRAELHRQAATLAHRQAKAVTALAQCGDLPDRQAREADDKATEAEAQYAQSRAQAQNARQQLLAYLAVDPSTQIDMPNAHIQPPNLLSQQQATEQLANHESLRIAALGLDITRNAMQWAPWRRWVQINTDLVFGANLTDVGRHPIYLVASWRLPIFDAGESARLQEKAKLAHLRAMLHNRQAQIKLRRQVHDMYQSLAEAGRRAQNADRMVDRRQRKLEWIQSMHQRGEASDQELAQAQLAQAEAQLAARAAHYRMISVTAGIDLLTGGDVQRWFITHDQDHQEPQGP